MDYTDYDIYESDEMSELLEDGVCLEHFTADREHIEPVGVEEFFGDPEAEARFWERAETDCSDGIMCEKYIVESLTGKEYSAEDISGASANSGRYSPEYGSSLYDVGGFLEELELDVERDADCTVRDLCEALENDEKIICAVSSVALRFPELEDLPGLSADSFVEVIGVDETDPGRKTVIVNDPFANEGGSPISMDEFVRAWEKSGCYAVFAK